ncbi:MAG: RAMP superfamily CRISPR-associated protein [Bacillota bacterium]
MHKYRLCSLALDVLIIPNGPIMVRSPEIGTVDPAIPDMSFVRTRFPGMGREMTVYLPGSSLKGVLRSYAEGVGRALGLQPPVCDPFDKESRCRKEENQRTPQPVPERYRRSCHICRLFGSTRLGGRIAISDAYPTPETNDLANQTANRTGVGINRLLGSSQHNALYDYEVVEKGAFRARIILENFELWQVGLLALALRALDAGHLRIGHGTSRGMGFVKVETERAELCYTGVLLKNGKGWELGNRTGRFPLVDQDSICLYGVAELLGEEAAAYGMAPAADKPSIRLEKDRIKDRICDRDVETLIILKDPGRFPDPAALDRFWGTGVERLQAESSARADQAAASERGGEGK